VLDDAAYAVRAAGGTCLPIKVDLMAEQPVIDAFATVRDAYGPVDILVNNVGQGAREKASSFAASEKASWDFLIGICLDTTILCTHQVVADMQARKSGKIVNISSDSALIGAKASAAHAAAKGGVISFTRSLARELAADQINVNAIAPGYIRTRALELLPRNMSEKALGETPMGRFGEPEDIANAVLFFASDMSRYVTGQTLIVNGGRWMN
jgi:NAD(P)-dependent dehydrogenase (short-subunit alcohol dehydrogenase family)